MWPDGLGRWSTGVRALGMDFGLWFEPECVSPVSALAEAHPDWFLQDPDRARTWRHEYTLDFASVEVREHVLDRMSAVIEEHHVDL